MLFSVATPQPPVIDSFTIVHIDRHSSFAGRQGREVRETWTVRQDGRERTVVVSPYHTNTARTTAFREGDTVTIRSRERHGVIKVCLSDVGR
ncbi:MAG: hypothetical protein JST30_14880 [Armatimonadetes bacterium]|nr:hypothetical protein [Armatimonadota bacterium]